MPDIPEVEHDQSPHSNTLVIPTKDFVYEAVQQSNGMATGVRFQLINPFIKPGDVLLVLTGADVHFHGLIRMVEDGWALATDAQSLLPAPTVN
ncbi:MAG: hypothetical protein U0V70_22070 [Terriglobia bacterium]